MDKCEVDSETPHGAIPLISVNDFMGASYAIQHEFIGTQELIQAINRLAAAMEKSNEQ